VCGIEFEDDEEEEPLEEGKDEVEEDLDEESIEDEEFEGEKEEVAKAPSLMRDRLLFYTGIVLIMIGGPGLAFGSWLHDVLSIPIIGETYAAFGWINVMFAVAGAIAMIVGIIMLVLSMRGGVLTKDEFEKLKAEGLT
jgi:uncharacterized membrane protein YcjF (UPF0283 family)